MMCAPTHAAGMPNYRRGWVPGGADFFTVNLLERHLGGGAVCGMAGSSPPYGSWPNPLGASHTKPQGCRWAGA